MTDPTLHDELLRLETALARRDVAALPGGYEGVLAEGFREIGATGRAWARAEVIEAIGAEGPADIAMDRFVVEVVGEGVALASFETSGVRRVRRSSVWIRGGDGRWRLRYHQGTPVPDEPAAS